VSQYGRSFIDAVAECLWRVNGARLLGASLVQPIQHHDCSVAILDCKGDDALLQALRRKVGPLEHGLLRQNDGPRGVQ
jgi:hypothetical protein